MSDEKPEEYKQALELVIDEQKVSVSGIQRKLKISYNEASKIIAQLEADGIISPLGEDKKRTVLVTEVPETSEAEVVEGDGTGEALPPADEQDGEQQADGWDNDGEQAAFLTSIEMIGEFHDLDTKSMVYDIRDALLSQIKVMPKPWSGTSQSEQRDIAAALENSARDLVRRIVEAMASQGVEPVRVLLTKVALGSDIVISGKVKTFGEDEEDRAVKILHHALNGHVMLTAASAADYEQDGRDAETDPDDPSLPFEGGAEDEEDQADGDDHYEGEPED